MRKFRIFIKCPLTNEVKAYNKECHDFAEASRFSYVMKKKLFDETGKTWVISSIHDSNFRLDAEANFSSC